MTVHTYTHEDTLTGPGGEIGIVLEINFTVYPEFTGDMINPPEGPSVDILGWKLTLTGPHGQRDCCEGLADIFTPDNDTLLKFAADDLQAEADDRADARRDMQREDAA